MIFQRKIRLQVHDLWLTLNFEDRVNEGRKVDKATRKANATSSAVIRSFVTG